MTKVTTITKAAAMADAKITEPHHAGEVVDINSASVAELMAIGGLDVAQANAIFEARPLRNWEELAHVPGFDRGAITRLKAGRLEIRTL